MMKGQLHLLKFKVYEQSFTLINVYGPNIESERRPFLDHLQSLLATYNYGDYVIIGGDFNFVPNSLFDKFSSSNSNQSKLMTNSQRIFTLLMQNFKLIDVWRIKKPEQT